MRSIGIGTQPMRYIVKRFYVYGCFCNVLQLALENSIYLLKKNVDVPNKHTELVSAEYAKRLMERKQPRKIYFLYYIEFFKETIVVW